MYTAKGHLALLCIDPKGRGIPVDSLLPNFLGCLQNYVPGASRTATGLVWPVT